MPESTDLVLNPSSFTSNSVTKEISEKNYNFKFLKMQDQVFIYIGTGSLDEIGLAMTVRNSNSNEVVATTAIGPQLGCDSQELAHKLAKRLKKQVYVSCNVQADRLLRPLIESALNEVIKQNPEFV